MIAQLFAKPHKLTIDGAIRRRVIRPSDGLDDLLARIRIAGMAGEEMQQSKLRFRQRKRPAFNEGFAGLQMKNDPVDFDSVGFVGHGECRLANVEVWAMTIDVVSVTFCGAAVKYACRQLELVSRTFQNDVKTGQMSLRGDFRPFGNA